MTNLPNKEFRQLVCLMREKEFYEPEEIRPIDWPKYNLAQIKDAKETLNFITIQVDEANALLPKGKAGKPLTNPKSLVKSILIWYVLSYEANFKSSLYIFLPCNVHVAVQLKKAFTKSFPLLFRMHPILFLCKTILRKHLSA